MDMELAKLLFQILQFLLTGAVCVYVYLTNKNKVTNERISRIEEDIDQRLDELQAEHGERLAGLEASLKSAPTHEDLGEIHEKINSVSNDVSKMAGKLDGISDNLRLILAQITAKGMK